jgi:glycosyltransferase involved in cell wall biosynthesis
MLALVGGPDVGLRQGMVALLTAEFEVHVFGSNPSDNEKIKAAGGSFHVYRLKRGIHPLSDLRTLAALWRAFRQLKPDVIHAYDSKPATLARLAARLSGVPVIVGTLPGMGSLYGDDRVSTRMKRWVYEMAQRSASRVSDLTIVQNEDDLHELIRRGVISAPKSLLVLGSGVDSERFRPDRLSATRASVVRSSLGASARHVLVMMVTRVIRSKGVLEYAAAAEILEREHPGRFRCVLVGTVDESSQDLPAPAELERLNRSLNWIGEREDIDDLLAASDVFVLPTHYREGIPRALIEAAACGLALVTTDTPGCRDVVIHEQTGLLIPPRDPVALCRAIERLGETSVRSELGIAARRLVEQRFDIHIICRQLMDAYRGANGTHANVTANP